LAERESGHTLNRRDQEEDSLPLGTARPSPLVDQVIAQLRTQIVAGEWPVGSRIPTEPELVGRLGVARNTVREAVRALAHAGLLEIRQGSGTYVRATSELAGVMRRRFGDADHNDVIELRRALEVESARLAAHRRTAADLKSLDSALIRREDAWEAGEVEAFVAADAALHQALVAAAHNPVLAGLYADLGELVQSALRAQMGDHLSGSAYVDHFRLVEAVRAGDPELSAAEAAAFLETPPNRR
jgi:DNA-binding FadR family transcriptional regulator